MTSAGSKTAPSSLCFVGARKSAGDSRSPDGLWEVEHYEIGATRGDGSLLLGEALVPPDVDLTTTREGIGACSAPRAGRRLGYSARRSLPN